MRGGRMQSAALWYARHGLAVFPAIGKDPYGLRAPHACYSASTDPEVVRSMFDRDYNIAIAGSDTEGVLDIDPRAGGDDALRELEQKHGRLPETPMVLTGGGGFHFYFRTERPLKNGAFAPGVEIKSKGGYVIAPPSIHPDTGKRYVWEACAHITDTPLAPMPDWIVRLVGEKKPPKPATGPVTQSLVADAFRRAGMLGDEIDNERAAACCPWLFEHTDGRGDGADSSTVIFAPTDGTRIGKFHCSHSHCQERKRGTVEALATLAQDVVARAREVYPDAWDVLWRTAKFLTWRTA